ncbi:EamA family transporter [Paenibacillus sp. FSL P2-0322]|uniref:EamA family transporter n=1 Tax=Paenibacillus sp. FSL P2-0322 TaxID=2921628 RepID=UPI0030CAF802
MPVSTLLLSYIILRDSFSFAHLAGAGFVFLGIMLISRGERRLFTQRLFQRKETPG